MFCNERWEFWLMCVLRPKYYLDEWLIVIMIKVCKQYKALYIIAPRLRKPVHNDWWVKTNKSVHDAHWLLFEHPLKQKIGKFDSKINIWTRLMLSLSSIRLLIWLWPTWYKFHLELAQCMASGFRTLFFPIYFKFELCTF